MIDWSSEYQVILKIRDVFQKVFMILSIGERFICFNKSYYKRAGILTKYLCEIGVFDYSSSTWNNYGFHNTVDISLLTQIEKGFQINLVIGNRGYWPSNETLIIY